MTQQALIRAGRHEGTISGVSIAADDTEKLYITLLIHTTEALDHNWRIVVDPNDAKGLPYRKQELLSLGWDGNDPSQIAAQLTGKTIAFGVSHEPTKTPGRMWAKTFLSNTPAKELKEPSKAYMAKLGRALGATQAPAPRGDNAPAAGSAAPLVARAARAKAAPAAVEEDDFT